MLSQFWEKHPKLRKTGYKNEKRKKERKAHHRGDGSCCSLGRGSRCFFYRSGKKKTDSLNNRYCPTMFGNLNYSDNGVFYYGNNGISYLDAETGRGVSICTKAGCRHEDTSCPAKVEALYRTGIVHDGKKLYYISDGDAQELESLYLTECDINGSNKKSWRILKGFSRRRQLLIMTIMLLLHI